MAASILRRSPYLLIAIALLAFALVAACGDDDGDSSTAPQPSVAEQPVAEPVPPEPVSAPEPAAPEEEMPAQAETAAEEETSTVEDASAEEEMASQQMPSETSMDGPLTLTVYSGRSESLVGPLLDQFETDTGVDVRVRYGGTAELAVAILEEGDRSPADVFFAQDAGALGALQDAGRFTVLDDEFLNRVDPVFRSASGGWVGVSGRARVIVYSTQLSEEELPASIFDLIEPEWSGRVGWAPTNGSFQAFVTAMRQVYGDAATADWLSAMIDNGVQEYPKNTPIVQAVGDGEIDVGLVNHYYLWRFITEDPDFPAANHYTDAGEPGALVNIAGVGLLASSSNQEAARTFIDYLLSEAAQQYFATETHEYPLIAGVDPNPGIPGLDTLDPPSLALTSLADLEGTLNLLREVGALP